MIRGNAAGKLAMGADGIEHFNFFVADEMADERKTDYGVLKDLTCLKKLRGRPKQYTLSSILGGCWAPPYEQSEQIPVVLQPRWRRQFRVNMCAEPPEAGVLVVQVVLENKDSLPVLGVRFNECWPNFEGEPTDRLLFAAGELTHHVPEHQAYNYRFPVTAIREGWNEIELFDPRPECHTARERHEAEICVVNLDLAVMPTSSANWPTVRSPRDLARWEWHAPYVPKAVGPETIASVLAGTATRAVRQDNRVVAEVKFGASATGLLLFGLLREPRLRPNLKQPWFGTGFELLVSHRVGKRTSGDEKVNVSQVFVVPKADGQGADGLCLSASGNHAEPASDIRVIAQPIPGGCEVAALVPWKRLGFDSQPAEFPFKLIVDVVDPATDSIIQVLAFDLSWEGWGPVESRLVVTKPGNTP
jgi:hypothetical protein